MLPEASKGFRHCQHLSMVIFAMEVWDVLWDPSCHSTALPGLPP